MGPIDFFDVNDTQAEDLEKSLEQQQQLNSTGVQSNLLISALIVVGADTDDELIGTDGDDTLEGFGGNDVLYGGEGLDTLFGGPGDDSFFGGRGDDLVEDGLGKSYAELGSGNDEFRALDSNDKTTVFGGGGEDTVEGGNSRDFIYGGSQKDVLFGGAKGNDVIYGGKAGDLIGVDFGFVSVYGGDGGDTIITEDKTRGFVYGEAGKDRFELSGTDLTVDGGADDDRFEIKSRFGGKGTISIDGGAGVDSLDLFALASSGDLDVASLQLNTADNSGSFRLISGTEVSFTNIEDLGDPLTQADGTVNGTTKGDDIFFEPGFGSYSDGVLGDELTGVSDILDLDRGNDKAYVSSDNITVYGGEGKDRLTVNDFYFGGVSEVYGGDGLDRIEVFGETSIYGGEGNDELTFYDARIADGGDGDDKFILRDFYINGDITILGGDGFDKFDIRDFVDFQVDPGALTLNTDGTSGSIWLSPSETIYFESIEDLGVTLGTPDGTVEGTNGNDTIDDFYSESPGGDFVTFGENIIDAKGGDDSIFLNNQFASQTVFGGAGADSIEVITDRTASIDGGSGDDSVSSFARLTTIDGGSGNDLIGFDQYNADPSQISSINGGDGNDTIFNLGSVSYAVIDAGDGDDRVEGGVFETTIFGGAGKDAISGEFNSYDSTFYGGEDNDRIETGYASGGLTLFGGNGDDLLFDESELSNTLHGDTGNDTINGSEGSIIFGGVGDDAIILARTNFNAGNAEVYGGDGIDTLDLQTMIDRGDIDASTITINTNGTSGQFVLGEVTVTFTSIEDFGGYTP